MMRAWLVVAGILVSGAAWADPPACTLLSEVEASTIFGTPVQPGQEMSAPMMDTCNFAGTDPNAGVSVTGMNPGSQSTAQVMYDGMTQAAPGTGLTQSGETPVAVSGLGDAATYEYTAGDSILWILAGAKIYGLEGNQYSNPDIKAALIAAGRKLVGG